MPGLPAIIVALALTALPAARHLRAQTATASVPVLVELLTGTAAVALAAEWKRPSIHLVAFAQDRASRQVLGAAEARP